MIRITAIALLFPVALALSACDSGTANAETRSFDFKPISRIEASAGFEVIFMQGPQQSVQVDSSDMSKVVLRQNGATLVIERPDNVSVRNSRDTVRITAATLETLNLEAGVRFRTDGLITRSLDLDIEAGVDAELRGLESATVDLEAAAGVKILLEGRCERLVIDASAGVQVDADGLVCRDAQISANTGSSVSIHASNTVEADAGVGGVVRISGNPGTIDKQTSLGGTVTLKN